VGLVQQNALEADIDRTLEALDNFYPLRQPLVDSMAEIFAGCELVLCDIAPAGIAAACRAGVDSVLIENFTWDWIYQSCCDEHPGFSAHVAGLQELYGQADYHLQAEPVCSPGSCDLQIAPIARRRRESRNSLRRQLQLNESDTVVLVTMGGIGGTPLPLERMTLMEQCFVVPGQAGSQLEVRGNLRLIPPDTGPYHPDLVAACDAVIGKVGYSTLAEVYQAGIPWGFIGRSGFRETQPLAAFIKQEMVCREIDRQQFCSGHWLERIGELCSLFPVVCRRKNGADAAAVFLYDLLHGQETGVELR
jgi:hypothetical protein